MSVLVSRSFTSLIDRISGRPDVVTTIDITPYLMSLKKLGQIAKFVNENQFASEDAKLMAYIIREIDNGIGEDIWRMVRYE